MYALKIEVIFAMAPTPRDKSTGRKPKDGRERSVGPPPTSRAERAFGTPKPARGVQTKPHVPPAAPAAAVVFLRTVLALCVVAACLCGAIAVYPVAVERSGRAARRGRARGLTVLFELSTLRSAATGTGAPPLSPHGGAEAAAAPLALKTRSCS